MFLDSGPLKCIVQWILPIHQKTAIALSDCNLLGCYRSLHLVHLYCALNSLRAHGNGYCYPAFGERSECMSNVCQWNTWQFIGCVWPASHCPAFLCTQYVLWRCIWTACIIGQTQLFLVKSCICHLNACIRIWIENTSFDKNPHRHELLSWEHTRSYCSLST